MAQSCDRIVHGLRQLDVIVDVVHFTRHLEQPKIEVKRNGRYIGYPLGDDPAHGLNCIWNLLEADPMRSSFTHVAAFGGVLPLLAGPVYAAWLGLPLVTLFRGNDFDAGIFSPKRADIVHRAIERSAGVCVVSRDKQGKIGALHPGIEPVWIPNGIDLEQWEPLPSDREGAAAWRAEHVAPERRVLGMFGQIKQKKGGLFFLESLLASGHADRFHLLFVGDIGEEVLAWLEANREAISHSIHPFIDRYELLRYYLACDFMVIPSFYDGLPNVLLESATLGLPSIASTAGGMGDLLVDGRHGYLFHPGDPHGCRHAIARAADAGDQEIEQLGEECRLLVRSGFDHITEARAYREVFIGTIHGRTPCSPQAESCPPCEGGQSALGQSVVENCLPYEEGQSALGQSVAENCLPCEGGETVLPNPHFDSFDDQLLSISSGEAS
jgi:glycosyltransferase involved in cell wall biosynthesis